MCCLDVYSRYLSMILTSEAKKVLDVSTKYDAKLRGSCPIINFETNFKGHYFNTTNIKNNTTPSFSLCPLLYPNFPIQILSYDRKTFLFIIFFCH